MYPYVQALKWNIVESEYASIVRISSWSAGACDTVNLIRIGQIPFGEILLSVGFGWQMLCRGIRNPKYAFRKYKVRGQATQKEIRPNVIRLDVNENRYTQGIIQRTSNITGIQYRDPISLKEEHYGSRTMICIQQGNSEHCIADLNQSRCVQR